MFFKFEDLQATTGRRGSEIKSRKPSPREFALYSRPKICRWNHVARLTAARFSLSLSLSLFFFKVPASHLFQPFRFIRIFRILSLKTVLIERVQISSPLLETLTRSTNSSTIDYESNHFSLASRHLH